MITEEEILIAIDDLGEQLNYPDWLRGIGAIRDLDGSPYIKVNVDKLEPEIRAFVPSSIHGIPIKLFEVGQIIAT